jgi:hypothetical protein
MVARATFLAVSAIAPVTAAATGFPIRRVSADVTVVAAAIGLPATWARATRTVIVAAITAVLIFCVVSAIVAVVVAATACGLELSSSMTTDANPLGVAAPQVIVADVWPESLVAISIPVVGVLYPASWRSVNPVGGAVFVVLFDAVSTAPMTGFVDRGAAGRTGAGVPVAWFSCLANCATPATERTAAAPAWCIPEYISAQRPPPVDVATPPAVIVWATADATRLFRTNTPIRSADELLSANVPIWV